MTSTPVTPPVQPTPATKSLVNQPPNGAGVGFLLTDGSVMFQGNSASDWWKLSPDNSGSYLKGIWTQLSSLPAGLQYTPEDFASAVLADGRVVIVGGEYNSGLFVLTNKGAIYDPQTDTWTSLMPPPGWNFIGDSPSVVMPDGQFLVGNKLTMLMAELDPVTLTWTAVGSAGKSDFNAEEGWTLMPDGTILTTDVKNAPNSEIYTPSTGMWTSAGSTGVDLHSPTTVQGCLTYAGGCYTPPGEIGPQILRPDGTVLVTGASNSRATAGHNAIYQPPAGGAVGTWIAGPDFPNGDSAGDSFAVLLPNGHVLIEGNSGTSYEFDGTKLIPGVTISGSLLVLPTGEVLVGGSQIYASTGTPSASWAPTIASFPSTVTRGATYQISGTQFNGLSQAAAFGDELETATNYPLVRITNNGTGHVFYARTHDHSTMGVATGSATVSTNFDVPATMEAGASSLVVVTNGIASQAVSVTVN